MLTKRLANSQTTFWEPDMPRACPQDCCEYIKNVGTLFKTYGIWSGLPARPEIEETTEAKTFYSEDRTTVYEHENEEVAFKVCCLGHTYPKNQKQI